MYLLFIDFQTIFFFFNFTALCVTVCTHTVVTVIDFKKMYCYSRYNVLI